MTWLASDWIWLALGAAFIGFLLFGRRGAPWVMAATRITPGPPPLRGPAASRLGAQDRPARPTVAGIDTAAVD